MAGVTAKTLCRSGLAAIIALWATPGGAQTFQGLGFLHLDSNSAADGASASGSVAAGTSLDTPEAFIWTAAGGMTGLGFLPNQNNSVGYALSSDGSTVVGVSGGSTFEAEGFLWTATAGMVGLGQPNGDDVSIALGVNADGSVVVGAHQSTNANINGAFSWTQAGGFVQLGALAGYDTSVAHGVSADGSVVVGTSQNSSTGASQAFEWTPGTGMVGLGTLPGDDSSDALAVSSNGATIVGSSTNYTTGVTRAFKWTAAGGMVPLSVSSVAGFRAIASEAIAVNADGSVIVGKFVASDEEIEEPAGNAEGSFLPPPGALPDSGAFIWTASTGMRSVQNLLAQHGVNLSGWQLTAANAVSADGTVISGVGTNTYNYEAWVATLDFHASPDQGKAPPASPPVATSTPQSPPASPPATTSMPLPEQHSPDQRF